MVLLIILQEILILDEATSSLDTKSSSYDHTEIREKEFTIKSNKTISFRVLAQIASAVPKRVKFDSIEYNGSDLVIIQGSAFSDQDILKFIKNF